MVRCKGLKGSEYNGAVPLGKKAGAGMRLEVSAGLVSWGSEYNGAAPLGKELMQECTKNFPQALIIQL